MKHYTLALMAAVLFCESTWANGVEEKGPYCASPDITPIDEAIVEAHIWHKNSLFFYVTPSLGLMFREDIQAAANAWNQHLPPHTQIELAFSEEEWDRKVPKTGIARLGLDLPRPYTFIKSMKEANRSEVKQFIHTLSNTDQAELCSYWGLDSRDCPQNSNGRYPPLAIHSGQFMPMRSPAPYKGFHRIWINDLNYSFSSITRERTFEDSSFNRTVLHEMGHALGLGHNNTDDQSVMYIGYQRAKEDLGDSDVRAIRCAYGMDPLPFDIVPPLIDPPLNPLKDDAVLSLLNETTKKPMPALPDFVARPDRPAMRLYKQVRESVTDWIKALEKYLHNLQTSRD